MSVSALWRRLDAAGHDAASLCSLGDAWLLSGSAVFLHACGPAALSYSVETNSEFVAKRGAIRGFVAGRAVDHEIRREEGGWVLDGVAIDGLSHLLDLDFSFTPATNALALKRARPLRATLPAAWFDLDEGTLRELPQSYERISPTSFRYEAPSVGYKGVLEFRDDGFVALYPELWVRED